MANPAISAQGSKLFVQTSAAGITPIVYTQVKGVKSFSGFDGSATEIDTTDLDSVAKEKILGLVDNGSFSIDVNRNLTDPGQAAMKASQIASSLLAYKLQYPDLSADEFTSFVKTFPIAGGTDAVMTATVAMTISGAVTPVASGA